MKIPSKAEHDAVMNALRKLEASLPELKECAAALETYPCGREVHSLLSAIATMRMALPGALETEAENTPAFRVAVERERLRVRTDRLSREVYAAEQKTYALRSPEKREAAGVLIQRLRDEWQSALAELSALNEATP